MPIYRLGEFEPHFENKASTWVAPSADIMGKVIIHPDVNIWFGAVLRGDLELIEVGRGSNIQDLSVIHTDKDYPTIIKDNCTIGHNVIVHGAFVDSYSLIGMGSVLLNGARIGKECLVGAGSLVTERKEFPDRSLIIGSPARVVRMLRDDEIEALHLSAKHYQENGKRFLESLKPNTLSV